MMTEHGGFGEEEDRQIIKHKEICKTTDIDITKFANEKTKAEVSELKTATGGWNKFIDTENMKAIEVSDRFHIPTDDDDSYSDGEQTIDIESDNDKTNKGKRQPNKRQRMKRRQQKQQQQQQSKQQTRKSNHDSKNGDDNQPATIDGHTPRQNKTTQPTQFMTHITNLAQRNYFKNSRYHQKGQFTDMINKVDQDDDNNIKVLHYYPTGLHDHPHDHSHEHAHDHLHDHPHNNLAQVGSNSIRVNCSIGLQPSRGSSVACSFHCRWHSSPCQRNWSQSSGLLVAIAPASLVSHPHEWEPCRDEWGGR